MERLFGKPVFMTFPNGYSGVHKGLTKARQVSDSSRLGERFREFAETMVDKKTAYPAAKRGFKDLFARNT